jgi:hypothetical protein
MAAFDQSMKSITARSGTPSSSRVVTCTQAKDDQAHVHAKTTLTVTFHRFNQAPIGRMAQTEHCCLRLWQEGTATARTEATCQT